MMKNSYEVHVGNIGSVHSGNNLKAAKKCFADYRGMSVTHYGKAAGESVTLFKNGEPIADHYGELDKSAAGIE